MLSVSVAWIILSLLDRFEPLHPFAVALHMGPGPVFRRMFQRVPELARAP
jgi:hypothetical protein